MFAWRTRRYAVRMSAADDRSEAARALNRARWGPRVALRAAATVVERVGELPDAEVVELAEAAVAEAERRQAAEAAS